MGKRGFVPDRLVSANREDSERAEIQGMPCLRLYPHTAHTWQMSYTGWCACPGLEWTPIYDAVLERYALRSYLGEEPDEFWNQS